MATTKKRLPARASATLQETIREAGPVGAATEALIWLGVGAAGLPITPAGRREIARLMNNDALAPTMLVALQQLYDQPLHGIAVSVTRGDRERDSASGSTNATTSGTTSATRVLHPEPAPQAVLVPRATTPTAHIGDDWQEFDD